MHFFELRRSIVQSLWFVNLIKKCFFDINFCWSLNTLTDIHIDHTRLSLSLFLSLIHVERMNGATLPPFINIDNRKNKNMNFFYIHFCGSGQYCCSRFNYGFIGKNVFRNFHLWIIEMKMITWCVAQLSSTYLSFFFMKQSILYKQFSFLYLKHFFLF